MAATADPVAGPILTGATGLPIAAQQINPGFKPPGDVAVAGEPVAPGQCALAASLDAIQFSPAARSLITQPV